MEWLWRNLRLAAAPGRFWEERKRTPSISKAKAKSGGAGTVVFWILRVAPWRNWRVCRRCDGIAGDVVVRLSDRRLDKCPDVCKIG